MDFDETRYVTPQEASKITGYSISHLRHLSDIGKIESRRKTKGGKRYFLIDDLKRYRKEDKISIIYGRNENESMLYRENRLMEQMFPYAETLEDTDSALNFNRPGLKKLIELVEEGRVKEIITISKEKLGFVEFGHFSILEKYIASFEVKFTYAEDFPSPMIQKDARDAIKKLEPFTK